MGCKLHHTRAELGNPVVVKGTLVAGVVPVQGTPEGVVGIHIAAARMLEGNPAGRRGRRVSAWAWGLHHGGHRTAWVGTVAR